MEKIRVIDPSKLSVDTLTLKVICNTGLVVQSGWSGGKDGTVVRAVISHQCGPGSIPHIDAICRLSLVLVLNPAPRVFSWVLRFSSLHKSQHFQIPIRLLRDTLINLELAWCYPPLIFLFIL